MNRKNRIQWQNDLARCANQTPDPTNELVTEIDLGDEHFYNIKRASLHYLCACLRRDARGPVRRSVVGYHHPAHELTWDLGEHPGQSLLLVQGGDDDVDDHGQRVLRRRAAPW